MNKWIDYPFDQHEVRVMCSDPIATAWDWISRYASHISGFNWSQRVTPEELVQTALNNLNNLDLPKNASMGLEVVCKGTLFANRDLDPQFWNELEKLTGTAIPMSKRLDFLSST